MYNEDRCNSQSKVAVVIIVLLLGAIGVVSPAAGAGANDGTAPPIDIVAQQAPIAEVLGMLSEAGGVNIVVGENVEGMIENVNLRGVSVEQAIRYIAVSGGVHWYKDDGTYIVTAHEVQKGAEGTSMGKGDDAPVDSSSVARAPQQPAVPENVAGMTGTTSAVSSSPPKVDNAVTSSQRRPRLNGDAGADFRPDVPTRGRRRSAAPKIDVQPWTAAVPRAASIQKPPSVTPLNGRTTNLQAPQVPSVTDTESTTGAEAPDVAALGQKSQVTTSRAASVSTKQRKPTGTQKGTTSGVDKVKSQRQSEASAADATGSETGKRSSPSEEKASKANNDADSRAVRDSSGGASASSSSKSSDSDTGDESRVYKLQARANQQKGLSKGETTGDSVSDQELTTTTIPVEYADAGYISRMLGGSVSETPYATGGQSRTHPGRLVRSSRGRKYGEDTAANSRGAEDLWSQMVGGGLGRSTGGGYGGRGGRRSGGRGRTGRGGRGGGGYGYGMRPMGVTSIIAYMPQNSLLVSGTPAGIDKLREVLKLLDRPTKQVEIATKFIEVDVTENNEFGIDWFVSNGSLEFFNLGFAPGEAVNNVVRWARGEFEAELGIVKNRNVGKIVNEPHITCQNNVPGYISFTTTIPYFTSSVTYTEGGRRDVEIEEEEVDVQQTLEVTPRINEDDTVSMFLAPIMEDQTGVVVGPNGQEMPIVATQELATQVTVPDGDTVVLGGMIRKQRSFNVRSTPLLSDIPIIGKLFQGRQNNVTNQELLVFVTPRIIRQIPAP